MKKSNLDFLTIWARKHVASLGSFKDILTNPSELQHFENDEDGDIAVTNAISGANEATATVNIKSNVHIAT